LTHRFCYRAVFGEGNGSMGVKDGIHDLGISGNLLLIAVLKSLAL
jgi:hypothetical protein